MASNEHSVLTFSSRTVSAKFIDPSGQLIDNAHFVEIGKASHSSYTDSFLNCCRYLAKVSDYDPQAVYMAITQNHLPSAGGSLIHPHLQINADRMDTTWDCCLWKVRQAALNYASLSWCGQITLPG